VRGELPGGFDFDLAYWRDQDDTKVLNRNYLDYAAVFAALASPDPARALNVFTTGGNSAAVLDAIRGDRLDRMNSESESAELVVRGDLFRLPGGPLRLAFGANVRDERIDVDVPGALAVAGGRKSSAVFLETRAPLIGVEQGAPLVHGLDLTVAVRHDRFSGDVETTNPQYGILWRLTPDFSLRATYGEAFKIPSLYNLHAPSLTLAQVVSDPQRGGEAADIIQRVGGNPDVQPETAEAWTVGFGWAPSGGWLDGLELSASLFHIEQSNFVQAAFDVDLVLSNPEIFAGRIQRATPTAADTAAGRPGRLLSVDTRSGNFGSVTVRGLDADLSYRWASERWGDFGLQLMASYIDRYDLSLVPGAPSENVVDIANGSGFPVDLKLTSVLSWDGGDGFGASLTARYRDSYVDFDGQRELPAQTVFDLQVSYEAPADGPLPAGLQARAGVINLTDEQGDFAGSFTGYDPAQTEMRGRFYYLELSRRF
jgi:outer membrane receptor protein involved in Fe transport